MLQNFKLSTSIFLLPRGSFYFLFIFFSILTCFYPKYLLRDFEKILLTEKEKVVKEFQRSVFFIPVKFLTDNFKVGTQVEYKNERPYSKFKQN